MSTHPIHERRSKAVRDLIDHWFKTDPTVSLVCIYGPQPHQDENAPVKLVQVTAATPASPDGVEVFHFSQNKRFPFPLVLAQVTPGEWAAIQDGSMSLPEGWEVGRGQVCERMG